MISIIYIDKIVQKSYIVSMYGEGWVFKGGKGGLSGGGGSNGEWIWGNIPVPEEEYTHECEDPLPYLGMLWEEETVDDEYRFEILMKRQCEPHEAIFSTYSSPAVLDYDEGDALDIEVEELEYLPIPEDAWESGEILFTSAYTSLPLYSYEFTFDGATYYSPYECDDIQQYHHDIVLATRGQDYLNDMVGDYEGESRLWGYYYQRTRIGETDWPGIILPPPVFGGPGGGGGVGAGLSAFFSPTLLTPGTRRG